MNFSRLPRRMLSCCVPNRRPVGRPRFTSGETIGKALTKLGLTNTAFLDISWYDLAKKRCVWSLVICPNIFYNGISHSYATATLARANKRTPLRTNPNKKISTPQTQRTGLVRHYTMHGYWIWTLLLLPKPEFVGNPHPIPRLTWT
jgi:hypothetical protein